MATLFHLDHDKHSEEWGVRLPLTELMFAGTDGAKIERAWLAAELFEAGGYVRVAEIEGDEQFAVEATQNGVWSESWSIEPPTGVTPYGRCGRRSTDLGDILLINGQLLMVDTSGFTPIRITQ
jgi:hypothetical protein